MSDENITDSATGNIADELSETGEVSPPATADIEGSGAPDLSQDIADILSSFSPQNPTDAGKSKELRKASRFRVKWHADILIDRQSAHSGLRFNLESDLAFLGERLVKHHLEIQEF